MHQNTFIGAPNEFLAALALRQTEANLAPLDVALVRHADRVAWVRPTSGVVAFPRWLGAETTTALSERLFRGG